MSGTIDRGLERRIRRPFVTIAIMLAVILMAAACSGGSSMDGGPELALQARPAKAEAMASPGPAHIAPGELRAALADMLQNPQQAIYREYLAGLNVSGGDKALAIYGQNAYQPYWITAEGHFTPIGAVLVERLESAGMEALDPATYHVRQIHEAMARGSANGLAAAELLLSDALIRYSADLRGRKDRDSSLLARAAAAGNFPIFLDNLAPPDPGYKRLRDALVRYNAISMVGGWQTIPGGPTLRPGDSDSRVSMLRRRLALSGDLPETADAERSDFDTELEFAVKRFQGRNGLTQDGAVGTRTLDMLNIPVEDRLAQLAENLQLQRRPESRIGERAIVVNIAAFELTMFDGGREVLRSRTVVGQPGWETPRLVSELKWLEINPTWSVPRRIVAEEIMPRLRKQGTDYLEKRGFRIFDAKWQEMDARELDFAAIDGDNLPFILRQDPGPANPLGNVKFMFPNEEAIFLHDTRARRLFNRTRRAMSHGCVRVEAANKLALFLLREEGWTEEGYRKIMNSGQPYRVRLSKPMPIHIVSRTAWVDADGLAQFRDDPYAGAPKLQVALNLQEIPYRNSAPETFR